MHYAVQPTPWYRQFWPWFIMALPASAVIAGIATVIIATQNQDSLVVDDYYKEGLAINQSIERDRLAAELGVSALLRVDTADTKNLFIQLAMDNSANLPATLHVRITHPTLTQHDQTLLLTHQGNGQYSTELSGILEGRWHITIEPADRIWRLTGRMDLVHGGQTQFSPTH